jgi:4-hydroxy-3-methylbut-2-enyl diphosphate reductase
LILLDTGFSASPQRARSEGSAARLFLLEIGDMNVFVRPSLKVLLASPRGFCAGVERAIQIVERAIAKYGAPIYVRHEIVHNAYVVERLRSLGAVFIDAVADCPTDRPLVFSAHGVPKSVPTEADQRGIFYLDATCPLVSKVHIEIQRYYEDGLHVLLIGHAGHPEVLGAMGQLPPGAVTLVQTVEDVAAYQPADPDRLAFVTQTTLSLDDAAEIVAALKARFPDIAGPIKEDICYATTNRQEAIKRMAEGCDLVLVVGSPTSSNSLRLVEVATRAGARDAKLIDDASEIDWTWLNGVRTLGLTAGASAPEVLVDGVIQALRARYDIEVEEVSPTRENVTFKLPRVLLEG